MKLEFKGGKGETLLLVEDNEDILELLTELFTLSGYNVIEAKKAKEACKLFKEKNRKIKLVLSDVLLPDGNGVDLVEKLLKSSPSLKVILTSGYVKDINTLSRIRDKGFVFLKKPFDLSHLLKTVRTLLDSQNETFTLR